MPTVLCEDLGSSRVRSLYANEIHGEDDTSATVRDLKIVGLDRIHLVPNSSGGNNTDNTVFDATKKVVIHGNVQILGDLVTGSGGSSVPTQTIANYAKDGDTIESDNTMFSSVSKHLLLKAASTAYSIIADHSTLVAHTSAMETANAQPDAFAIRGDSGTENRQFVAGMVHSSAQMTAPQTGTKDWRGVIDAGINDLEMVTEAQLRLSADASSLGKLRLAAGSGIDLCPSVGTRRGQDPDSKLTIAFSDTGKCTKIAAVSLGGAANKGENILITGDTMVAGSSVTVEEVKFENSAISTTNADLTLSAASKVKVDKELELTSTSGGKVTAPNGVLALSGASGSGVILNNAVSVNGPAISATNADLTLSAASKVKVDKELELTSTSGGKVTAPNGVLALSGASGSGVILNNAVSVNGPAISATNADLTLSSASKVKVDKELELTSTSGGKVTAPNGVLALSGASGSGVTLNNAVSVNGPAISATNADLTLSSASKVKVDKDLELTSTSGGKVTATGGALTLSGSGAAIQVSKANAADASVTISTLEPSLVLNSTENVKVNKLLMLTNQDASGGDVSTSTGPLNLRSKTGRINVASTSFEESTISTGNGALSLDATTSVNVKKTLKLSNSTNDAGDVTTINGPLNLSGNSGVVNVAAVKVEGSAISTISTGTSVRDLTLTSDANVKVTRDLVLTNSASTGGNITTSNGPLNLLSQSGVVNVSGVNVTGSTVQASANTLALTAPVQVAVKKDLVLTNTAGTGGRITTPVGGLELTSATGEVTVSGNLNVAGNLNTVNQISTNVAVSDKVVFLATPAGTPVATWQFDSPTPGTDTIGSVSMTVKNGAIFQNERLEITQATHYATAESASWPWRTPGFHLSANFTLTSLTTTQLMSYENFKVNYNEASDKITVTYGTITVTSPTGMLVANKTVNIALRKDEKNTKLHLIIDNHEKTLTEPSTGALLQMSQDMTDFPTSLTVTFGHAPGDSSLAQMRVDDVRLLSVAPATNALSSGAGIAVDGDGKVDSIAVERSIKWNAGTNQDGGDASGSYWHIRGGQLLFSRVIGSDVRKAPGTDTNLSSLPSDSEIVRWDFPYPYDKKNQVQMSVYGSAGILENTRGTGLFTGLGGRGQAQVQGFPDTLQTRMFTFVMKILPPSNFNTGGSVLTLFTYGNISQVGQYIQVYEKNGGIGITDGAMREETSSTGVPQTTPFILGVDLSETGEYRIYVDGYRLPTSRYSGAVNNTGRNLSLAANTTFTLGHPSTNDASRDVGYNNVRICAQLIGGKGQVYGYASDYYKPLTVTYGFRVADDETLQLVKLEGSTYRSGLIYGTAAPATDSGNSLGTLQDGDEDVISKWDNIRP